MENRGKKKERIIPLKIFAVCTCLILAVVVLQSWWTVKEDKNLTLSDAEQDSYFTVRILEEHANRAFSEVVQFTDSISEQIANYPSDKGLREKAFYEVLSNQRHHSQLVTTVSLFDVKGHHLTSEFLDQRLAQLPSSSQVSPQLHVVSLINNPTDTQLRVGAVVKLTGSDQWVLPVAKNVIAPNGERVCIIEVQMRLNYLQEFYELVARGSVASVSLHDASGNVLIGAPADNYTLNRSLNQQALLSAIAGQSREGSLYGGAIQDGNAEFLYTYRKVDGFPLTLLYARSVENILSDWKNRVRHKMLYTSVTLILILALTWLLLRQVQQLNHTRLRIEASEERYRLLFSGSEDAILLMSQDHIYVDCNPAAVRLFGVSGSADIVGHKADEFSSMRQSIPGMSQTDNDSLVYQLIQRAFDGFSQRFESIIERNGATLYTEATLSLVELNGERLLLCTERDISAQKYSEQLLEAQNHLLQLIGANEDPLFILSSVCDFVEKLRPFWCVGIQLLADDQRTFIQSVGQGFPDVLSDQIVDMPVTHGSGIWSEAVLVACPVQLNNFQQAPSMQFVNGLETLGKLNSGSAWPLMDKHGHILGSFTVLLSDSQKLSDDDMSLIGIMIEIATIAIEGRRSEKKILQLAHYDELTGLPNRFLYHQHLAKALALAERNSCQLAVLFLDLDRFKNINDTFGHDEGDRVLRSISQRFRQALRESDIIARVGGDEFILLVDQFSDPRDLGDIADKLLFEASQPFEIHGQECQLSASIGIATFPADGHDAQTLLKNADIAMYRAKNKGKDNYQFYASEMNTHTIEQLAFEARLRKALERLEFVVYYQPKISLQTGKIVGAEALVRWDHPERGILYPGDFIALAEETGLISRLGMLVLDVACRDVLSFRQIDADFGRIAINLSGSQFNDPQLLDEIKGIIDFWRVPADAIEFEITESMVMHNREQAIVLMDGFRSAGFSLSIDDFGTGYSSLAYLKRFPVDSVKVDRSFIKDIPEDPNDTAIVLAIVAMAHTLGLKVIAEGVDAHTQLATLRDFKCDEYQGFYFSKAVPAKEFLHLLQTQTA